MHALSNWFQSLPDFYSNLSGKGYLSAVLTFQILEGTADFSQKKKFTWQKGGDETWTIKPR